MPRATPFGTERDPRSTRCDIDRGGAKLAAGWTKSISTSTPRWWFSTHGLWVID